MKRLEHYISAKNSKDGTEFTDGNSHVSTKTGQINEQPSTCSFSGNVRASDVNEKANDQGSPSSSNVSSVAHTVSVSDVGSNSTTKGRTFQASWTEKYHWLRLDTTKNGAVCTVCTEAVNMKMSLPKTSRDKDSFDTFVTKGFSNWKKALDRFKSHEASAFHKAAIATTDSLHRGNGVSELLDGFELLRKMDQLCIFTIFEQAN